MFVFFKKQNNYWKIPVFIITHIHTVIYLTYYYRNHIEVEKFLKNFEVNFGYKVNLMKSNKLVSGHGQPLSPDTHNNHLIQINNKTQKINNKKQQMVEMIRKFETSMDKKLLL